MMRAAEQSSGRVLPGTEHNWTYVHACLRLQFTFFDTATSGGPDTNFRDTHKPIQAWVFIRIVP